MTRWELVTWGMIAVVLVTLSIPWFLWKNDAVVAGLPLWLWWHVAWMCLASIGFYAFARRAWGLGIERDGGAATGSDANAGNAGNAGGDLP